MIRSRKYYYPIVVGTLVSGPSVPSQIKKAKSKYIDIVEVRLDSFPWCHASAPVAIAKARKLLKSIQRVTRKPLLLTLRSYTESGVRTPLHHRMSDEKRMHILSALLPMAHFVDVEIRHTAFASKMTRLAHREKVTVIHSYHEFKKRLLITEVMKWSKKSLAIHGDIFKVAMTPRSQKELEDFLSSGLSLKNPGCILIGMGRIGQDSRYLGFSFRSIMSYGHLGRTAAPGQIAAERLGRMLRDSYGRYK